MASVESLGLHHPTGLHHAIAEQLIPPNAPSSQFSWSLSSAPGESEGTQDELLTTKKCVIWSRGGVVRKTFRFDLEKEAVVHALIAHFPATQNDHGRRVPQKHNVTKLEKAVVVFLKSQAHIYFVSGTEHIVHLPFEVESAVAGPVGIIIQRKRRAESTAPLSLKFPRVPQNSFISSQLTAFSSSQQTNFSVESLGNPKSLHFGNTLDSMWEAPLANTDSHWPRMMSLMDPLLEIGLVVMDSEKSQTQGIRGRKSSHLSFLDQAEEILHLEEVQMPNTFRDSAHEPLILAVTANRDNGTYSVWRIKYLKQEDPFIGKAESAKAKANRRRSSMPPPHPSNNSTPLQPNLRESLGATLPGKKVRKSGKAEKAVDLVTSLEQEDKEGSGVGRRSSRRVSSMMARADLSASHDRNTFAEPTTGGAHGTSRRQDSLGVRLSSSYNHQIHPSLGSLLEAPFHHGLDEGLNNMGLDDHDFDGLQQEVAFYKISTTPMDNFNVRYSMSEQPAQGQSKVFILCAPPFGADEHQRSQLLIGIQDTLEKRLQIMMMHLKVVEPSHIDQTEKLQVIVSAGEGRRAQNVVDSCKIYDGSYSALLVLSEAMDGRHELSVQAPWSELTKINLPVLLVDDIFNLQYKGRPLDRDVQDRKSEIIDLASGSVNGLRNPGPNGVVDIVDLDGRLHQLQIQLEPTSLQVLKILHMCRSVLQDSAGERIYVGWLHIMQWLQHHHEHVEDPEWSALTILLFSYYLNVGKRIASGTTMELPLHTPKRSQESGSLTLRRDEKDAMRIEQIVNSPSFATLVQSSAWQWVLDEGFIDDNTETNSTLRERGLSKKFIPRHINFAKEFMNSAQGETALGSAGYMPTALGKSPETRRKVAVDVFMGLHLLLEEQKLDIMTPESHRVKLRLVMCQISRWLKWPSFSSEYDLGVQEDVDPHFDTGKSLGLLHLAASANSYCRSAYQASNTRTAYAPKCI